MLAGQELDLARLKADLAKVYDLGVSELVDFTINNADEATTLVVQACSCSTCLTRAASCIRVAPRTWLTRSG